MIGLVVLVWLGQALTTTSQSLPPVLDITRLEAEEPRCQADLMALRQALDGGQLWAQQMVDAGVKSPVGLLSLAGVQFGDFDECLSISAPSFSAQYCLVDVRPNTSNNSWSGFLWALCVPDSCSVPQLTASLQSYLDRHTEGIRADVVPQTCTTEETSTASFSSMDIVFCMLLAVIFLVVIAATVHDVHLHPDYDGISPPDNVVQCLSARYGYHSLFRRDRPIPGIDLGVLYGLHSCAMFFVIMGHRFGVHLFFMTITNYRDIEHMFKSSWFSIWAGHLDLFVDFFFFMSSFLLSVMYYGELHKRYISPLYVYLHRVCRLLPVYLLVVLFYMTLLPHLGSGPLWNLLMESEHGNCRDYWWTNVLFLNNYVNPSRMLPDGTLTFSLYEPGRHGRLPTMTNALDLPLHTAGEEGWRAGLGSSRSVGGGGEAAILVRGAASGDVYATHLVHILRVPTVCATPILLLLKKKPRLGVIAVAAVFIASTVGPFWSTFNNRLEAIMLFDKTFWTNARNHPVFSTVYTQGHYRGTSYLMGLLAGCYVFRHRDSQLSKGQTYGYQLAGTISCLLTYWSGSFFYMTKPDNLVAALYAAFFHTVFGFGLSLVVISFTLGHNTSIKVFFSWKIFVPLSKLSYCTYLLHLTPQLAWLGSLRSLAYLNPHALVSWAISDVALCLVAASVLYLTVETPSRGLMKHFIHGYSPFLAAKLSSLPKESCCVQPAAEEIKESV